jgi:hypothetical protein
LAGRRRHRQQEFLKFLRTLDLGLGEAMGASYEMVKQAGFWEHLALVIVFVVIASLANGAVALPATPFLVVLVAVAYYVAAGRAAELERAAVCRDAQTATWAGRTTGGGGPQVSPARRRSGSRSADRQPAARSLVTPSPRPSAAAA